MNEKMKGNRLLLVGGIVLVVLVVGYALFQKRQKKMTTTNIAAPSASNSAASATTSKGPQTPTTPTPITSLQITNVKLGDGAEAKDHDMITVNYTGWLYDPSQPGGKGEKFDSSLNPGRTPFSFRLGAHQVIPGWDKGVAGMKVGGERELIIPPDLGYGAQGAGSKIPPNATLLFDVHLLSVNGKPKIAN